MIFELREYDIIPGFMLEWISLMQEQILPLQMKYGITFIASFVPADNPNKYIWIRRFNPQNNREQVCNEMYESPEWKENIKPKIDNMLNYKTIKVTLLHATDNSPIH